MTDKTATPITAVGAEVSKLYVAKLESDRARLIDLANRATNMRPALLMTLGYVPEPVLEFCNEARALLRELERK